MPGTVMEEYGHAYAELRRRGAGMPTKQVEMLLRFFMNWHARTETNWGAIDALADELIVRRVKPAA